MQPHPRYEILGLIGNGDFAAVYRARDRELGRDVAIKQIHGQYLHDPQRLARFWQEAQLLAALAHPHIMTIYDIDRPRGWLVLELMQGTLLDASRGEPIDLALLRSSLVGSLQALPMLHSHKVIHGDIKPSNLMLDRLGQIKLGDFGLARRVASDQGSYLKGATRYMAPELVAPQFGPVGPTSDLYSLGFSAYELLAGPQQFQRRLVAAMALALSVLVSVLIAVMPSGSQPPPVPPEPIAVRGVVRTLLPERHTVIIEQPAGLGPKEVVVRVDDRIYLNNKLSLLRELRESDQIRIEQLRDEAAVATRGGEVEQLYRQGRQAVGEVISQFDQRIAGADSSEQLKLRLDRQSLRHYASFSPEAAAQQVVAAMDAE